MFSEFLISGLALGLAAGISPGPLFALVISESLLYGRKEGIRVALAPLVTDAPIILITYFIMQQLRTLDLVIGVISVAGALFLFYLGYINLRITELNIVFDEQKNNSLKKAILTNLLSPHPYIFWLTVGGSFLGKGKLATGSLFVAGFYLMLVGSKIILALLSAGAKDYLKSEGFLVVVRLTGVVMIVFGVFLLNNGWAKFFL
jgi:threonine/homoserine/homoserine lactone efflux protein